MTDVKCRALHGPDGMFIVDNINEWQHSVMYLAFLISGAVDLVGFYAPKGTLPPGTEQVSCVLLLKKYLHCLLSWSLQLGLDGLHLCCLLQGSRNAGSSSRMCCDSVLLGCAPVKHPCEALATCRDAWG